MFLSEIPPPFIASDNAELAKQLLEAIGKGGVFAAGAIFGAILSGFFYWLASKERTKRDELDAARLKELLEQLKLKDTRIDELHREISKRKAK